MGIPMWATSTGVALVVHALVAPLIAIVAARHYFLPEQVKGA